MTYEALLIGGPDDGIRYSLSEDFPVVRTSRRSPPALIPPHLPWEVVMSKYDTYIRKLPGIYVHDSLDPQVVSNRRAVDWGEYVAHEEKVLEAMRFELIKAFPALDPRTFSERIWREEEIYCCGIDTRALVL